MKNFTLLITLFVFLGCLTACQQPASYDSPFVETLVDVVEALSIANTASAPVNPYALPIGIGLAGITAMLEALRRKERAARKHAETKLNGNANGK